MGLDYDCIYSKGTTKQHEAKDGEEGEQLPVPLDITCERATVLKNPPCLASSASGVSPVCTPPNSLFFLKNPLKNRLGPNETWMRGRNEPRIWAPFFLNI